MERVATMGPMEERRPGTMAQATPRATAGRLPGAMVQARQRADTVAPLHGAVGRALTTGLTAVQLPGVGEVTSVTHFTGPDGSHPFDEVQT